MARPTNRRSGVRTLRDLNGEDEDDKTNTNFFTGGEKSGLQVEDPNERRKRAEAAARGGAPSEKSLVEQIFERAKEQMDQPDDRPLARDEGEADAQPHFLGAGFKLGDGTEPSTEVRDPAARRVPSKVTVEIIFWKQGFTVADGPLHRYDDPANAAVLQELNRGRVPMSLLDVEFGQDVDVSVYKKTEEEWTPPKRKAGGFHGQGQRLGSPVPGEEAVREPAAAAVVEALAAAAPEAPEGDGDATVQIRFANGRKTSHRFRSSDPVSAVYEFVRGHRDLDRSRAFVLSHAFPVKPIANDDTTVEAAKLKNSVVVQRWQ